MKEADKRLTASILAEEKRQTASKLAEIRIREAVVKATLNKEVAENKTAQTKIVLDYKQAQAEKRRIDNETRAQLKAQQKSDSKFTGQSVELGSLQHIQGLKRTLGGMTPGTEQYSALNTRLKEITANYNIARGSNSLFNRGLLETGENLVTITAGLYFAATGLMRFAGSTVTAFAEQEKSQMQLKAVTGDNIAQYERFMQLSADVQDKWGIPDEVTQSLIAYSVAQERSEGQITKNIEAARILAIVQGIDIQQAYKQVEATLEGNTRSLGRNEKDFKGLTEEQLQNGAAVDLIISKWGKLGNIQDSTSVKTAKLSAAWSETKETIGSVIVDALSPLGESLANIGLKGQDVVKWVASAVIGIDKFSGIIKITDKASKELILTFGNMAGQLPLVGGFYSSMSNYAMQYRDVLYELIGVQNQLSNSAIFDNARGGNRGGVVLKDPTANSGTIFKGGNTGNKSGVTKEMEEQLNLVKLQQAEWDKLDKQLAKNLGDLGAENQLRLQMLDIEREIFRLRYGADVTMKNLPGGTGIDTSNLPPLNFKRGFKLPSSNANGLQGDMTSAEIQAMLQAQLDADRQSLLYAENISSEFLTMLEATGLMSNDVQNFVKWIQQAVSFLNSSGNIVEGVIGFVGGLFQGGGSPVGGNSGGGGLGRMSSMPNYGMPDRGMVTNVYVQGTVKDYFEYKVVKTGNEQIARRGSGVYE